MCIKLRCTSDIPKVSQNSGTKMSGILLRETHENEKIFKVAILKN